MVFDGQLRSVITWDDQSPDLLFSRWTEDGDEIKNASKLIIGPGQGCLFVYEGQVKAVHRKEGLVNLKTDNVPFWTTIKSALQGMESEHKVGIWYFRQSDVTNVRWGTPGPIRYLDPVFQFPVGLCAHGNFSARIADPEGFFRGVVGSADEWTVGELQQLVMSRIMPVITDILAKGRHSYVDVDAHRGEISAAATQQVAPVLRQLGFELTDFRIEGTSFDEATQKRIGQIADMAAAGQAARAAGIDYTRMQQLEAMRDAAKQQGLAGAMLGLNAAAGLGQLMGAALQPAAPAPAPAPAAPAGDDVMAKLAKLKQLSEAGLITEAEYAAKKKELLDRM